MQKLLIFLTICLAFATIDTTARHNSGEIMFISILSGEAEVPSVNTDARGVTTFNMNGTMDTLFVNGTFAGLSGKITGAHIHQAEAGMNGDIVIGLTSHINGNQIMGFVTGEDLTSEKIQAMLDGNTYLNIHTEENPAGEIRGQLMTETDYSFYSELSGDAEVPAVSVDAEGFANVIISKTNKQIWVNAVYSGLTGDLTGAHLHAGIPGENGDVLVNLTDFIDGNQIMGSVEIDASLDLWSKLANGEVYINLHTKANPGGELRGDLEWKEGVTLRSIINTDQEVPAPVVSSMAQGNGYIHFNNAVDSLTYMIYFEGLTGDAVAAHFHEAVAGMAGPPIVDISSDINGNWIVGTMSGENIDAELLEKFLKGQIYINIHTVANAAGEIRGQVAPNTRIALTLNLEGEQENPGVRSMGYGSGAVTVSNSLDDVWFAILAENLSGEVEAAHFHNAEFGMNGDVVIGLNDYITQGSENGVWIEGSNVTDITSDEGELFAKDLVYLNLHTAMYPSGELRGQVELYAKLYFDNGILPFDPMFTGKLSLHSQLSSDEETHTVNGDARGTLGIVLSEDMDSLYFNTTVNNLTGPITGAHFHKGMAGEDGAVDVDLTQYIQGNVIAGTVTDFNLEALLSGQYYLNVHTAENPAGETRGQIMLNSDWAFTAMLSPENEVHDVTSDGKGMVVVRAYPDEEHFEIKVLFDNTTSSVTGAHLHMAPKGVDGEVVVNLTNDIQGNMISTTVMNEEIFGALIAGDIYLNVHTENNSAGELRGQLTLQRGLFFDTWLNGAQENPPTGTNAMGLAAIHIDAETGEMIYDVFTAGVETEISGTHIHEGTIGVNGNVVIDLTAGILNNVIDGKLDISADLKTNLELLLSGDGYLNVHSSEFPSGEIRGQVQSYNRETFAFNLNSDQEVPPISNSTTGTGVISIINDWNMLNVDVAYANFDGKITGAHIHQAEADVNGDVVIDLTDYIDEEKQTIRGNITAEGGLNSNIVQAIMSGEAYINIHSEENPSGETRGQINNTSSFSSPSSVSYIDLPSVNLYPNPVVNQVTVNIAEYISAPVVTVVIYDMNGRMSTKSSKSNDGDISLDVSNFLSGTYFIEILGDDNNIRTKFIKQ